MGTFRNPTAHTLRFDIGSDRYEVPPGAECEIPRALEYVPAARGLPLVKVPAPTPGAPRVEPVEVPRPRVVVPAGVEAGAVLRARAEAEDDDGAEPDAAPASEAVVAVADRLAAAGVALPGVRPARGRRG